MFSKQVRWLLAALVAVSTLSLVFTVYGTRPAMALSPVWAFGNKDKYYVFSAEWLAQDGARARLMEQAGELPLSEAEVRQAVAQEMVRSEHPVVQAIESDIRHAYGAQFKETYRQQVEAESREMLTQSRYYHMLMSYQVLEQARADFLEHNRAGVASGLLKKLAGDAADADVLQQIDAGRPLLVDRGKYFAHVLRHIQMEYDPVGVGVSAKGKHMLCQSVSEVPNPLHSLASLSAGRVRLADADRSDLKLKHAQLANYLRGLAVPPPEIYHGTGVVISASKAHFLGAVNVLVRLRESGSELPVEIVVDTAADADRRVCDDFLPKHNAKCVVLETELGKDVYGSLNLKGFPLKSLGLLVSSFDHTLHLDADTFPAKNVDFLFETEPYLQTKFVLWPDSWHKTTSPLYYDIAGYRLGEVSGRSGIPNDHSFAEYAARDKETVQLHDLAGAPPYRSVESGQLLVSKREHFRSLFLAFYYNLHGPSYYYPLLYQGSFGSGDRETFVAALHAMNEPYYLTDWHLMFSGVDRPKPQKPEQTFFDESTMVQHDPQQAWAFIARWKSWLEAKKLDTRLYPFQDNDYTTNLRKEFFEANEDVQQPEPLFLHVHDPKINSLYNEQSKKSRYDYKSRYIQDPEKPKLGGTDWDLHLQAINTWVTCEVFTTQAYWAGFKLEQAEVCKKSKEYLAVLESNTKDKAASELKVKKEMEKAGSAANAE